MGDWINSLIAAFKTELVCADFFETFYLCSIKLICYCIAMDTLLKPIFAVL